MTTKKMKVIDFKINLGRLRKEMDSLKIGMVMYMITTSKSEMKCLILDKPSHTTSLWVKAHLKCCPLVQKRDDLKPSW